MKYTESILEMTEEVLQEAIAKQVEKSNTSELPKFDFWSNELEKIGGVYEEILAQEKRQFLAEEEKAIEKSIEKNLEEYAPFEPTQDLENVLLKTNKVINENRRLTSCLKAELDKLLAQGLKAYKESKTLVKPVVFGLQTRRMAVAKLKELSASTKDENQIFEALKSYLKEEIAIHETKFKYLQTIDNQKGIELEEKFKANAESLEEKKVSQEISTKIERLNNQIQIATELEGKEAYATITSIKKDVPDHLQREAKELYQSVKLNKMIESSVEDLLGDTYSNHRLSIEELNEELEKGRSR